MSHGPDLGRTRTIAVDGTHDLTWPVDVRPAPPAPVFAVVLTGALAAFLLSPLLERAAQEGRGLAVYTRRWEMNDSVFVIVQGLMSLVPPTHAARAAAGLRPHSTQRRLHRCMPEETATGSRKPRARASPRNRTIERVQEIGRQPGKKEAGYHQQARAENALFRSKTIVGDRLRARSEPGRKVEARIACDVLNRMTELGRPESVAIRA
jgi:hypothetical protein